MFTGIVEEVGRVAAIEKRAELVRITTEGRVVQDRAQIDTELIEVRGGVWSLQLHSEEVGRWHRQVGVPGSTSGVDL